MVHLLHRLYGVDAPEQMSSHYLKFSKIILKLIGPLILFIATIQDQRAIYIFFE